MEYENLLTGTKWEILQEISQRKQSPLELAKKLNTTIANISQQLRLLEAAGIVKTEKTRESEKGKPRVLYSFSNDLTYIVCMQKGFAKKRLIQSTPYHNIISRIWQLKNVDLHNEVQKAFWKLETIFDDISKMGVDELTGTIHIESKKEKKIDGLKIKVKFVSEIKDEDYFVIYEKDTEVYE